MSNSIRESLLLIFIKNPQKGRVKTRLAQSIGDDQALKVYRKLLYITKSVSDPLDCNKQVWYSEFIEGEDLWSAGGYEKRLQAGEDLGERMKDAFRQTFSEGYQNVVIIGSDCAGLTSTLVKNAFSLLGDNNVVIGPSEDGGYYLLGMSTFYPQIFEKIPWSTPDVLDHTLERVNNLELSYKLLPERNDIDTIEDLQTSNTEILNYSLR